MIIADLPRTLRRRWYVTVAGLALTAVFVALAFWLVPASQQVKASVLLLPPRSAVGTLGNPYLGLSGLRQPSDVVIRALTAQGTAADVKGRWPHAEYTVEPDYLTSGPIIVITVEDPDPVAAMAATKYLLSLTPATLDNLQAVLGVRPNARITSTVVARDDIPEVVRKTQLRAVVVALGAGLGLTALAAAFVDGVMVRRGNSRSPARSVDVERLAARRAERPSHQDEMNDHPPDDIDWWASELAEEVISKPERVRS